MRILGGAAIGTNGCIYTWGTQNADTGEYVTAPEKLNNRINDFGGDSFGEATSITDGLTHGNMLGDETDYYKFIPASTGIYSIYSISALDLVCRVYIKNTDGTYTLKFSNDDSGGIMGGNSCDFFLSKPLTGGTTYYINVYPYDLSTAGEYSLNIKREKNTGTLTFNNHSGEYRDISVNVNGISGFTNRTIAITYDSEKLELVDGCMFTPGKEISAGAVFGTSLTIVSANSGELVIKASYSMPYGQRMSGTINIIRFKTLADGYKTLEYKMDDLS